MKIKKIFLHKKILLLGIVALFCAMPLIGFAQSQPAQVDLGLQFAQGTGLTTTDIRVTIASIIRVALGLLGIVAVVLMMYGGFVWMTAGGEQSKIDSAKKILLNATIGLAIILSAFAIASFVLSSLKTATTVGSGGGSGSGGGGAGLGGGGAGGASAFKVTSITPSGTLSIRNPLVHVYFNKSVDGSTVDSTTIKVLDNQGNSVAGTYKTNGTEVVFTPNAKCPKPHDKLPCFDASKDYSVNINTNNSVKSSGGQSVSCSFGSVCNAKFKTGTLIDTQDPSATMTLPIDGDSVSVDAQVKLEAQAQDDAGIASVLFAVGNSSAKVKPQFSSPQGNTKSFTAQSFWDTTGLKLLSQHTINATAKDLASRTKVSSGVTVTVRAAHCFNKKKDADETGKDCGGKDCGVCKGGSCSGGGQCQPGALCINNKCQVVPLITGINPDKTAPETFVTISGRGFGKYIAGGGPGGSRVNFIDSKNNTTAGIIPQSCSAPWTDNQIIVEVPKGLADQDYVVEVISANKCGAKYCSDRSDDLFGMKKLLKVDAKATRPSLCSAKPSSGSFNSQFELGGKGFGTKPGEIFMGSFKTSHAGVWVQNQITKILVPNLSPGTVPVSIKLNGKVSNAVDYTVVASSQVPIITLVSPDNGNEGQYVQISGSGFGTKQGKVWFEDKKSKKRVLGDDQSFPKECSGNTWNDNQIVVKVPTGLTSDTKPNYDVIVETAVTKSNSVPFTRNNKSLSPGFCLVVPSQGPANTAIKLFGENFGTAQGRINFNKTQVTNITKWGNQLIESRVPPMSPGNTKVQVLHNNTSLSNKLDFVIGSCKANNNTCAVPGQNCCADGTCQKVCPVRPKLSTFTWKFSTGVIPEVSPAPEVLQEQFCNNGKVQSPSPYIAYQDACPNADIRAFFTVSMDGGSLAASGASPTIQIFECKDQQNCSTTALTGAKLTLVKGTKGSVDGLSVSLPLNHSVGQTKVPLKPESWYQVKILGGSKGVKSAKGVNMVNDFIWQFKTRKTICPIASVGVYPPTPVIDAKYSGKVNIGTQELEGTARAQNCNVLNNKGLTWQWSIPAGRKAELDFEPIGAAKLAANQTLVKAIKESGATPVPVSAQTRNVSGKSDVTVNFTDPAVIDFWPNCNEACVNSAIGAEFQTDILASSIPNNVDVYLCDTGTCLLGGLKKLGGTQTNLKGTKLYIQHTGLAANEFYRVVLKNGIKSSSGVSLTNLNFDSNNDGKKDSYSWTLRTKNDTTPCGINEVRVNPASSIVRTIGAKQDYLAEPLSKPDACSSTGQKLDPYAYDWKWGTTTPNRANVFTQTQQDLSSIQRGCSSNCLATGSTWHQAVCGNGIKEFGEDCDDGNSLNKDGCSEICLSEGVAGSCGNGTIERGEDCDDGNKAKGDGCSDVCLNEGKRTASFQCDGQNRRGKYRLGEECADNNTTDGDGCSAQCLNEGSKSKSSISVCGDGVIDAGESCDVGGVCDGGTRNGQACGKNQGCPGDYTKTPFVKEGICKPVAKDGCTTSCKLTGNKAATCGDKTVDSKLGEQCDEGVNNGNGTSGCSSLCLLEGSSFTYDSLCGNGVAETGEVKSCELPIPAKSKGSPYSWATAKKFVPDGTGASTSTSKINTYPASQSKAVGLSNLILQCGYRTDRECGNSSTTGRAADTCCYARPVVKPTPEFPVYPANDPSGTKLACTNTQIQVPFDMPMDEASFTGKVIIAEGTTGACPAGTQKLADSGPNKLNWCVGGFIIGTELDGSKKLAQIRLTKLLKDNTFYRVIVKGDEDLTDGVNNGIASLTGVGYNGPTQLTIDNKKVTTYAWVFKTGTRCLLSDVKIQNSNAADKEPFAFRESGKPKPYKSIAIDQKGRILQAIPGVYEWTWDWSVAPSDIFTQKVTTAKVKNSNEVTASGVNGRGTLSAEARIDSTSLSGVLKACFQNSECNSGICLAQNNQPCSGSACGTSGNRLGHCRVSKSGQVAIESFICNNPWPATSQFGTTSYEDKTYNFRLRYCRDAGISKVCRGAQNNGQSCTSDLDCNGGKQGSVKCVLEISDDLPVAKVIPRNVSGKVCVGGARPNNTCSTDADCKGSGAPPIPNGTCQATDLLGEYLLLMSKEQKTCHDTNRTSNNVICSTDADCQKQAQAQSNGYVYCYADAGKFLQSISDAVGVRVMKNPKHLSPAMWYQEKISATGNLKSLARVDGVSICLGGKNTNKSCSQDSDCPDGKCLQNGYRAVSEGRTVYVNAVNAQNNLAKSFYTNIYLMSYNQGARAETLNVYNQLLKSWIFNSNITDPVSKSKAQRDTIRLEDLNYINDLVNKYRQVHGVYPQLAAGSYIKGMSLSTWPSWNQAFSSLLGVTIPVDPLNRLKQCGSAYSEKTCWDAVNRKLDPGVIDTTTKKLQPGSFVYQYYTKNNGQSYEFHYNTEFLGLSSQPSGGTAYQCFDDAAKKWVNNGSYHSKTKRLECFLGSWRNTCGNGKVDIGAGEQCDGNNVSFCSENIGVCDSGSFPKKQCRNDQDCGGQAGSCKKNSNIKWHGEVVQTCSTICELTPTNVSIAAQNNGAGLSCGGFCGDGVLNGNEKCDINNTGSNVSCSSLGWGDQGQVGCNLNSCGFYGGGCINGPLGNGDIRIRLEWARKDQQTTDDIDLDAHLLVPYNNGTKVASYGGTTGNIFKNEFAWVSLDDRYKVNSTIIGKGPDIDGDGKKDGLEIIAIRQNPSTQKYHPGTYRFVVRSFNNDKCFATNCKSIRVIVTQKLPDGRIVQHTYPFPGAQKAKGFEYWHVFDMNQDGNITEVKQNMFMNSLPPYK